MLVLPPETVTAFLDAARERFAEGTLLLNSGHHGGAVYLFGYVAELVLKAVAYRHFGTGDSVTIQKSDRTAVEDLMKQDALVPKGHHDILKWAKYVVLKKGSLTGMPYPQLYGMEIESRADLIDRWWAPQLRYHILPLAFAEALAVQQAARWFLMEVPNL
jgi:hypothetical protein